MKLVLNVNKAGDVQGLSLKLPLPAGHAPCSAGNKKKSAAPSSPVSVKLLGVDVQMAEEGNVLPIQPRNMKGLPFPGQAETSAADLHSAAMNAELSPAEAESLQQAAAAQASQQQQEGPKSFLQQYWKILLPLALVWMLMNGGGGGGGEQQQGQASGAAGGAGRQQRARND